MAEAKMDPDLSDLIEALSSSGSEQWSLNDMEIAPTEFNDCSLSASECSSLTMPELLLNNSRITPTGNGNPQSKPFCNEPTSGQKWWAAVLLGFVFAIISSPAAYYITSSVTLALGGIPLTLGPGPTVPGLILHTILYILIVRLILW